MHKIDQCVLLVVTATQFISSAFAWSKCPIDVQTLFLSRNLKGRVVNGDPAQQYPDEYRLVFFFKKNRIDTKIDTKRAASSLH